MAKPFEPVSISEEEFGWVLASLADYNNTRSLRRFHEVVESMSQVQQRQLVSIFLLGRGDFDSWKEALVWHGDKSSAAIYLSEKSNLQVCLIRGWDAIPSQAKFATPEECDKFMRGQKSAPTVALLDTMLSVVARIEKATEDYLVSTDVRPPATNEFLVLLYSAQCLSAQRTSDVAPGVTWYTRKIESLQSAAHQAVKYWLMNTTDVNLLPTSPWSAEQWIRDGMCSGLNSVEHYAGKLREVVQQSGADLIVED